MASQPTAPADGSRSAAELYHELSSFGWFDQPPAGGPPSALTGQHPPVATTAASPEQFEALLASRTSVRDFGGGSLSRADVVFLLRCGYGHVPGAVERRTAPSAGGLYPLTLVTIAHRVTGLAPGWYRWKPRQLDLDRLPVRAGSEASNLFRTRHVDFPRAAAVVLVLGALGPVQHRYGERGYRYLLLEAGHVAQNLLLAATSRQVAAVPLGGFDDESVNHLVAAHVPGAVTLYAVVVGQAADGRA